MINEGIVEAILGGDFELGGLRPPSELLFPATFLFDWIISYHQAPLVQWNQCLPSIMIVIAVVMVVVGATRWLWSVVEVVGCGGCGRWL